MTDRDQTGRRAFLTSLAAASVGLAGCSSIGGNSDQTGTPTGTPTSTATPTGSPTETPEQTETPGESSKKQPNDPGSYAPMEAKAASFEDLSYWTSHAGVKLQADSETYYQGSQSARVEGRSGTIQRSFPVPIDLSNKDLSFALNIDGPLPTNVRVYLYDTGGNVTRLLQRYHGQNPGGWVRINPSINAVEADMSSIQRMLITIDGGGAEKKFWVDDLKFHDKAAKKGQVMFTFDYITRSIYEVAYPMMKERDIQGVVAVPADNVGNADRLNYEELKEMQEDGWEIASMSNDWQPLAGQSESIQRKRMERANRLLEENGLGKPSALMYPKGFCDDTTLSLAEELHDVSFLRYGESEAGLSQSAIMGPQFVNRSRPNTPEAAANQMDPATAYNGLYTIAHSKIGPNAENTRSEFRAMLDEVQKRQQRGELEVVTASDVILK